VRLPVSPPPDCLDPRRLISLPRALGIVGPNNVSYFHTPDIPPNKEIFSGDGRIFSYSKFRIRLRLWTSYKIRIHSVHLYAFNRELDRKWEKLLKVSLLTQDHFIRPTLRKFEADNSKPNIGEKVNLDNGNEDCDIEVDQDGSDDVLIARLGQFSRTLPDNSRKINDTDYCDVLIILHINTAQVLLLCSLPVLDNDEKNISFMFRAKVMRGFRESDALTWATKVRPRPNYAKRPNGVKLRLKAH